MEVFILVSDASVQFKWDRFPGVALAFVALESNMEH